jgi:SGS domain/CS domain
MEHAARGAAALDGGDAFTALSAYTQALVQHPSSPDYFVQRSTAFTRLKAPYKPQHELSLADAEYAVLLGQRRAKREKIQAGQQRRVIALFGLHQYGNAAFVLDTMKRWRTTEKKDKMEGDMWKAKIDQKLNALPEDDPARQITVKEYPDRELPNDAAIKKMVEAQLKADGTFSFPGESEAESGAEDIKGPKTVVLAGGPSEHVPADTIKVDRETTVSIGSAASPSENSSTAPQPITKIRHEWFQNTQNVNVTLYAKGVSKDKAEIDINEDFVAVSFPHPSNPTSIFSFTLDPLFGLIDTSASTSSIMSTKVELILRKQVPGQKWGALEGSARLKDVTNDKDVSDTKVAVFPSSTNPPSIAAKETAPSYPTSSRSGPKNWDKLADDLTTKKHPSHKREKKKKAGQDTEEESEHENQDVDSDYGGDPVDGFFKKLYAGADDDTRRAMMKSYQESGGTALSTNWTEVGKKKVEPYEEKTS